MLRSEVKSEGIISLRLFFFLREQVCTLKTEYQYIHYVLSVVGYIPISPVSSCKRAIPFCFYSSLASQRNCGEGDDKAEKDTCVPIVERAAEAEP